MKRKDSALQPGSKAALKAPARVCGAPTLTGDPCQRPVAAGERCPEHGGLPEAAPLRLPAGCQVPVAFKANDRQRELERFVADCLLVYELNDSADLRQTLLAGIAFVRLQFDGETMKPTDVDLLSKVVDRHLRALRATPKEQAAGKVPGGAVPATPGMGPAAILERVRLALTPGQLAGLVAGRLPAIGASRLVDGGASLQAAEAEEIFQEPRRAQADPFAALDGPEEEEAEVARAPLDPAVDPFGD